MSLTRARVGSDFETKKGQQSSGNFASNNRLPLRTWDLLRSVFSYWIIGRLVCTRVQPSWIQELKIWPIKSYFTETRYRSTSAFIRRSRKSGTDIVLRWKNYPQSVALWTKDVKSTRTTGVNLFSVGQSFKFRIWGWQKSLLIRIQLSEKSWLVSRSIN